MKTRFLSALIGAVVALGGSAAMADVALFGHIDTSFDATDQDGGGDDVNVSCTTCSVGFKGSEDLGNGLKAIFKLDFQFDSINRNKDGSITDRDQWLGLAGNFGKVRVGSISTSYKSHGAKLDPIYRTSLQGRDRGIQSNLHRGAGEEGQGRATNTLRYDSPSWNGLKVTGHYTLDGSEGDGEDDDPYGAGVSYENGDLLVFADYITSDVGGDDSAYKVGGKYSLGMFSFFAQYEVDDGLISARGGNQTAGTGDGADVWMVGASATLGNTMAYLTYGQGDDGGNGSVASGYDAWELVAAHNMSKRTMLYAGFSQVDCNDPDADVCSEVGASGGEDDKFSFGMKHKF